MSQAGDREGILQLMLEADIIIYDMLSNLEEATWAVESKIAY
jgi:hypothetical protein